MSLAPYKFVLYAMSVVTEHRKLRGMGWDGLQWPNTTVLGVNDGLSDLESLLHVLYTLLGDLITNVPFILRFTGYK